MSDDPRDEIPDPLTTLIAQLDQHLVNAPHIGRLLATEWAACVEHGMSPVASAVLIGTRWSSL